MRSTQQRARHRQHGFSLLEVIVALAILGIGIVSVMQLFSGSLRTTARASNYTSGLIHARSILDEALAAREIDTIVTDYNFDNDYTGEVEIQKVGGSEEDTWLLYQITVTVRWPPQGMTRLSSKRFFHVQEE